MLEQDLCNNLKAALPLSMLQQCPNDDDVCFIEKVTGTMEAALEISNSEVDMHKNVRITYDNCHILITARSN